MKIHNFSSDHVVGIVRGRNRGNRAGTGSIVVSDGTTEVYAAEILIAGAAVTEPTDNVAQINIHLSGFADDLTTISPAQLTSNTDNWNPTSLSTASVIRISTDASRNLTGITAPAAVRAIVLENVGSFDLVLKHDVTSTAANRFFCPNSADFTMNKNSAVLIEYDTTSTRWRVVDTASGVPTGAVTTSGLTMSTGKLLGRTTASTGAIEEITPGTGLTLATGSLTPSYRSNVWTSGTSMPGSPTSGDRITRTDTSLDFVYNGTLWLSTHQYFVPVGVVGGSLPISATSNGFNRGPIPYSGIYAFYVEAVVTTFFVSGGTALSGSHKWVGVVSDETPSSLAYTVNINSGASDVWRRDSGTGLTTTVSSKFDFEVNWTKTGTPGTLYMTVQVIGRIIGT